MIIAMTIMGMMQMPVHQIVDMITVRNCVMSAPGTMDVILLVAVALVPIGTLVRMGGAYREDVLINMAFVRMMQVSIVQIVEVSFMHDCPMSAIRAMFMGMVVVNIAGSHV
jgi:hypothetical protein